jgi:hypothetical protein
MRPASPRRSQAPVTAENVRELLPSAEAAALARQTFERAGFDVGPLVGNSFSITAPMQVFNTMMDTRLQRDRRTKAVKAARADGTAAFELPLSGLPQEVKSVIESVTFTPPPDFGPTSY